MAIGTDFSVTELGDIRYGGAAHGAVGAGYYTVIEFHRWLQDLADDASSVGNDILDITDVTPSGRDTDNIINLLGIYNIDQTASEHLYDGSIIQGGGTDIWDGIVNYGNEGIDIQLIQNGAIVTNDFWNFTPDANKTDSTTTVDGINATGQNILNVVDGSVFAAGDYIMIGTVLDEKYRIHSISTNALTLASNIVTATSGAEVVYTAKSGLNRDLVQGISHRFMVKTRTSGTDVDTRRILGITREYGKTYNEFNINATARGNNVLALTNATDGNNSTVFTTAAAWEGVGVDDINNVEGYQLIDINNDTVDEAYYAQWNRGTHSINDLYEYAKYWTRVGSAETIYGLDAQIFRGVTHEITIDTPTGTFVEPEAVSWSGISTGTGQLLAIDSTTAGTKMWIQLLTGAAPSATDDITGVSLATANTVSVVDRSSLIKQPFIGTSTGSALSGAYGIGVEKLDLTAADKVADLTNASYSPPDYRVTTVGGIIATEDRVLVGPATGGNLLDDAQFTLNAAVLAAATDLTVKVGTETPGTGTQSAVDTPATGTIRVLDDTGIYQRVTYTGISVAAGTMTFTGLTGCPAASIDNEVFISYIDDIAASTSITFTAIYDSPRTLFARVRDGGTVNATPIKTFENTVLLGASISAIRTPDE